MLNFGIPLSWLGLWLAWVWGRGCLGQAELAEYISFGLGIGGSAFQISSWGLDCGFSGGNIQAGVLRSVLTQFGWSQSLRLGWPGLCS